MMKNMIKKITSLGVALLVLFSCSLSAYYKKPRLTVIMVVDQFAYNYIRQMSPYLKHGIKFLMQQGIVYENALFPHATPSTGPGFTGLNTGTTADYHGIVGNFFCNPSTGKKMSCDDDDVKTCAVINPKEGVYDYGKGPVNIMVDGITDQFVLSSQPGAARTSLSLSIKSRSAICTANKMGKAIWFDTKTGLFTSSKYYYDQLPAWLAQFNRQKGVNRLSCVSWPLFYPRNSAAYNFKEIDNYTYSAHEPIAGKTLSIGNTQNGFALFEHTPAANQLLFDLAAHAIQTHITRTSCQEMLLWVCLSPLDFVGHDYGPQSREAIDMIYHLDCQIAQFMDRVSDYLKRTDVLYVLTADHGVSPIPELLNKEGYPDACRIDYTKIIQELNCFIDQKFGVSDLACSSLSTQIFFKDAVFKELPGEKQKAILDGAKQKVSEALGVKKVWTYDELMQTWYEHDQIESYYKRQLYPGRSGNLIIQPFPYCIPDEFKTGTGHRTPYEPDVHVPLILYQKHNLEKRVIYDQVWALQLAPSLAHILRIPRPSASRYHLLPGLIDYDPITGEVLQTVVL
jgi:hypothetical protein